MKRFGAKTTNIPPIVCQACFGVRLALLVLLHAWATGVVAEEASCGRLVDLSFLASVFCVITCFFVCLCVYCSKSCTRSNKPCTSDAHVEQNEEAVHRCSRVAFVGVVVGPESVLCHRLTAAGWCFFGGPRGATPQYPNTVMQRCFQVTLRREHGFS